MSHKLPQDGGCWFCHKDEGDMLFSTEFDTYLHKDCLIKELEKEPPINQETRIMSIEFGLNPLR